jgi:hypothetical protein
MRALAIAKASAARKREKESQVKNQGKTSETGRRHNIVKKLTLGSLSSFQELHLQSIYSTEKGKRKSSKESGKNKRDRQKT